MASGSPDLFVVCKSCGSEVSPYITECPYCGARLRKRAPKLDEPPGTGAGARRPRPKLTPIMPGEIPGISADPTRRPWATAAIVVLSLVGAIVFLYQWFSDAGFLLGSDQELYRALWAPFVYVNEWYGLVVVVPIALFGWLLERRHGPLVVLGLFAITGMATYVVTALLEPGVLYLGAPGGALGLLAAWAMPDLLRERRGVAHDGDLIGVAVLGIAVALMPAVVDAASVLQALIGLVIGALAGLLLSRTAGAR